MNYTEVVSTLLMIIGGVTILTNIIVQVFKTVTWDKIPTNFFALIVSEALTLAAGAAYAQIQGIAITWYLVFAAVVVGLLSAYARPCWAMTNWSRRLRTGLRKLNDRRSRQ